MDQVEVSRHWETNAEDWTRQAHMGLHVYRDTLNTPAFLAMLPSVKALRGLDIGCGDGSNTRLVAGLEAAINALDVAPTFLRQASAIATGDSAGLSL